MERPVEAALRRPIQELDPLTAERIAAGEVVERPASAVKELVENALDAGATSIEVRLEEGGKKLIEVTDNGSGIPAAELPLAVLRHATSKLRSFDDLENLRSLGFRGEALPSIASVAELTITTRTVENAAVSTSQASQIELLHEVKRPTARQVSFGLFLGAKHGTRIQVRSLFSQVPARLKFLKSQGAEVSQVRDWMERLALSYPQVEFSLKSDERSIFQAPIESEADRVKRILSDHPDSSVLCEKWDDAGGTVGIRAKLYWIPGLSLPAAKRLVQVINSRAVRDRFLQQALLQPFRQSYLPGQFPALALMLDIDPARIDVNVHPSKTEVRLLDSSKIFRIISDLGERLIERQRAELGVSPALAADRSQFGGAPASYSGSGSQNFGSYLSRPNFSAHSGYSAPSSVASLQPGLAVEPDPSGLFAGDYTSPSDLPLGFHTEQYRGILFNTYLLFDQGDEVCLIDQHAAHERVRFEALKRQWKAAEKEAQILLIPETTTFAPEQAELIEGRLSFLKEMGFDAEIFGERSVLFRSVPPSFESRDLRNRLQGLIERLLHLEVDGGASKKGFSLDEVAFEKLASEACHSSVRSGDRLESDEALGLLKTLFQCQHPWNCPHGRPTVVRIPRTRFDEWFQRIV